jgi:serine/threonine-protein kinase
VVRLNKNDRDGAAADFDVARRLEPRGSSDYYCRGWAWSRKSDHVRAIADFNEATRRDPTNWEAQRARAWTWATCPDPNCRDGKKAVESATKECERTNWDDSAALDILAAASAEAGDFDAAVKWQSKANAMYSDALATSEARLRLYQAKTPYRHEWP